MMQCYYSVYAKNIHNVYLCYRVLIINYLR